MPIIQVQYEVPLNIYKGLALGELSRFGSVVRGKTGIIKHLKEVKNVEKVSEPLSAQAIKYASKNKGVLIGVGIFIVAVGGVTYLSLKNNKEKKDLQKRLTQIALDHNIILNQYLEEIKNANLKLATIESFINDLELLEKTVASRQAEIDVSITELNKLKSLLRDYTMKLAETNLIKLDEVLLNQNENSNPVRGAINYLEAQKAIFQRRS